MTASKLVLVTSTVKVKVPPGAGLERGLAVLTTVMVGGTLVIDTVALAVSVAVVPWESVTTTVTRSDWDAPASAMKLPVKLHVGEEAPGARVVPMRAPQVLPARVARVP